MDLREALTNLDTLVPEPIGTMEISARIKDFHATLNKLKF
jgi:hypothetical protein